MEELREKTITHDPVTNTTASHEVRHQVDGVPVEVRENRANDIVWWIAGIVNALLALRFLFLLFGANRTGFTRVLYEVTDLFVAPFRGIFSSPGVETGFFDSSSILAIVIYSLIAWAISSLLMTSAPRRTVFH